MMIFKLKKTFREGKYHNHIIYDAKTASSPTYKLLYNGHGVYEVYVLENESYRLVRSNMGDESITKLISDHGYKIESLDYVQDEN